jgi:DNA repair protein RadC
MDKRSTTGSSTFTFSTSALSITTSGSLWSNARNLVLSNARADSCSDMASPRQASSVRDRQVLERLLNVIIPQRAARTAQKLLDRYGTLPRVFAAFDCFHSADPVGELLGAVRGTLLQSLQSEVTKGPVLCATEAVVEYLTFSMSGLGIEEVRVLFLDTKNRVLRDEVVSSGTINEAAIYPREILRRALEYGSTAMIIAHNHPSGDPQPSQADIDATKRLIVAGRELGIVLHDHIIVAREGWVSLKSEGVI